MGCNNQPSNLALSKEDSVKISQAMVKRDTIKPITSNYTFTSIFKPDVIIPRSTADSLHVGYLNNPITNLVNSNNEMIRGFKIEKSDFDQVKAVATNGARIYFGFDGKEYRLMLVGVDLDGANVSTAIADDFFPCPTYCPNGDLSGTAAQKKKRFESDFNYKKTEGNVVTYIDFGGVEKTIRYQ